MAMAGRDFESLLAARVGTRRKHYRTFVLDSGKWEYGW